LRDKKSSVTQPGCSFLDEIQPLDNRHTERRISIMPAKSTARKNATQSKPNNPKEEKMAKANKKPNILIIWGDDIGWFNVSAYNNGIMGYRTPNIDRVAKEGALFTDWYGQQSCTAGRAAFITGQSPIRTGLTKVGLPGADLGLQPGDPTIADVLKPLGYVCGQFGKNHLGDRDEFLPTAHGFDEFFGNLYHLNAEEEPENPDCPKDPEFRKKVRAARRAAHVGSSEWQTENRGHRATYNKADGDGGRGVPRCEPEIYREGSQRR
jgi:arylsulfatase A-like enzyme